LLRRVAGGYPQRWPLPVMTRLALTQLRNSVSRTGGLGMTFAAACRAADKAQRRKPKDLRLEKLRRLMADDISLERADAELRADRLRGRAAEATVDALAFSLRSGVGALKRPNVLRRLSELSDPQVREIAVRLQKFKPNIAPAWTAQDLQVLLAVRSKVRG
jgi:hypothetical protein